MAFHSALSHMAMPSLRELTHSAPSGYMPNPSPSHAWTSDNADCVNFPGLDIARLLPPRECSTALLLRQPAPGVCCRAFVQRSMPAASCDIVPRQL